MIQCALNGDYTRADHPAVPVTLDELVADSAACWAAGAASVHLRPNRSDQVGALAAPVHDAVVSAVRAATPGLEISVLDGGWNRPRRAVVDAGLAAGREVRVGLEDSLIGRNGRPAPSNPRQGGPDRRPGPGAGSGPLGSLSGFSRTAR